MARSRRRADKGEGARDGGECKLGVIRRVEEVLHSQIAIVEKICREMFVVERAKRRYVERTHHAGVY